MAAGFKVRNSTSDMRALFTIEVLAPTDYAEVDLDAAKIALTTAYAKAFAELSQRVEAARDGRT